MRQPTPILPLFVGSWTPPWATAATSWRSVISSTPGVLSWVANLAVYVPFQLPVAYPMARLMWVNGSTASSNVDVGIYTVDGELLVHAGTTAQSGASAPQYVAQSLLIPPGRYYWAIVCDGTTSRMFGAATFLTAPLMRTAGLLQQAVGSASLPATMTPAVMSNVLYPMVGMTRTASGF